MHRHRFAKVTVASLVLAATLPSAGCVDATKLGVSEGVRAGVGTAANLWILGVANALFPSDSGEPDADDVDDS